MLVPEIGPGQVVYTPPSPRPLLEGEREENILSSWRTRRLGGLIFFLLKGQDTIDIFAGRENKRLTRRVRPTG